MTIFYLITWIFIGNFTFLNIFLAILLDGFGGLDATNDLGDAEGYREEEENDPE